jgi:WD40 repeat protein
MSLPERVIHGRYRVIYAIDEQAGAAVFCCRDDQSGALVYVAEWTTSDAAIQQQLSQQSERLATISDPALLPLISHAITETGFIAVSSAPQGHDLGQTVRMRNGALTQTEVTSQMTRILAVVRQLHSQTPALYLGTPAPSDIIVRDDGQWMLTPFAMMRGASASASPYRAPEVPSSGSSPASDMYAIAALVYFASTGVAPLTPEVQASGAKLIAPRTHNPSLNEMFEQVLLRALQTRVSNRYQSAAEMQISLDTIQTLGTREPGPGVDSGILNAAPAPVAETKPASSVLAGNYTPPPVAGTVPVVQSGASSSNMRIGCLVAAAITLTILAVMLCIVLALVLPGSPLRSLWGGSFASSFNFAVTTPTPVPSSSKAIVAATPTRIPTITSSNKAIDDTNAANLQVSNVITSTTFGPAAWAPNGQAIAIAAGDSVSIHEVEQFSETAVFRGHVGNVTSLAWSPDGRYLASGASNDSVIHVWDVTNSVEAYTLRGHEGWIRNVIFSPDGKRLASGSTDLSVRIWDTASQRTIYTLTGHTDLIGGLAWSSDGTQLATAARDGSVRLWDTTTGQPIEGFTFQTPINANDPQKNRYWATGLVWTPDGKSLFVGATNGLVTMLNAQTGQVVRTLSGHTSWITIRGLQLSTDGTVLYSAGLDGLICVWDVASGTQKATYNQHQLSIFGISLEPDGNRLVSTSDQEGRLLIWDMASQQIIGTFRVGQGIPTGIRYSNDGKVLAASGFNGMLRLQQTDKADNLFLAGLNGIAQNIAFLGTNRFAMITASDTISLYTPESSTPQSIQGLDGTPLSLAASRDGKYLAVGTSTTIQIWRIDAMGTPFSLQTTLTNVQMAEFAPNGNLLAVIGGGEKPGYEVWDVASRSLLFHSDEDIGSVDFMTDSQQIVVLTAKNSIEVRPLNAVTASATITSKESAGFAVVKVIPGSNLLVAADYIGNITCHTLDGKIVATLGQGDGITALGVNPDGTEIAVGKRDGSIARYAIP